METNDKIPFDFGEVPKDKSKNIIKVIFLNRFMNKLGELMGINGMRIIKNLKQVLVIS